MTLKYKILSVILCDDIRREDNGKEILIGVYGKKILTEKFPILMPVFSIRLEFDIKNSKKMNAKILLRYKSGASISEASGEIQQLDLDSPVTLGYTFSPAIFHEPGECGVFFSIDGLPLKRIHNFFVLTK